jgi:hypothetical protein
MRSLPVRLLRIGVKLQIFPAPLLAQSTLPITALRLIGGKNYKMFYIIAFK